MAMKQMLMFDFHSYGPSDMKTKWRTGDGWNADCTAVTTTASLNPCCGKRCSSASLWFMVWGKNNRMSLCVSKQELFNPNTAAIQTLSFPLHFLDPTSHPSQGHVHPVACWRCFFPFFFFFSLCGFMLCKCSRGVKWWWTPPSLIFPLAGKAAFVTDV